MGRTSGKSLPPGTRADKDICRVLLLKAPGHTGHLWRGRCCYKTDEGEEEPVDGIMAERRHSWRMLPVQGGMASSSTVCLFKGEQNICSKNWKIITFTGHKWWGTLNNLVLRLKSWHNNSNLRSTSGQDRSKGKKCIVIYNCRIIIYWSIYNWNALSFYMNILSIFNIKYTLLIAKKK